MVRRGRPTWQEANEKAWAKEAQLGQLGRGAVWICGRAPGDRSGDDPEAGSRHAQLLAAGDPPAAAGDADRPGRRHGHGQGYLVFQGSDGSSVHL